MMCAAYQLLSEDQIAKIDMLAASGVEAAMRFARASAFPSDAELLSDVYANQEMDKWRTGGVA
jgi:TPP-dependent pyruvate/acetoin dehydrogenase alpha subunit